ncbi:hypothetical protein [Cellulomonas sp. KRMCY2]|uniref:hypothetical protein n=1 Tax=Cellulomonas sp. KRMCY2 TaxID=1304865 RepID=UPI00045EB743|nr:hypothetical protein [Cellulomonas sp. KRMCY2]
MTARQRAVVVPVARQRAHNSTLVMSAAADVDPVFRRWWMQGVKDRLPRAEAWLAVEGDRIDAALRRRPT